MSRSRKLQFIFLLALSLLLPSAAHAQSGRRSTRESSKTPPTTPSVSGPKPVEKKPDTAQRLQLLVGINGNAVFATVPYYLYDTVLDNCIRRLGEAEIVFATSAGNRMARGDAIKAAKLEKSRYVVLLDIGDEYADAGKQVKNGQNELYVDYVIFEPQTGKVKQSGRAHQRIYQTGRGGVLSPKKNSPIYSEYALRQAAREAADRVLAAFDIKVRDGSSY
jgi:hypothetical protein